MNKSKKSKKPAAKAKAKKAAPKKKVAVKAKAKVAAKPKAVKKKTKLNAGSAKAKKPTLAKAKPSAGTPRKKGLTLAELFALKKEKEQAAAQNNETWKGDHSTQAAGENELHDKFDSEGKKSGFGGTRHH